VLSLLRHFAIGAADILREGTESNVANNQVVKAKETKKTRENGGWSGYNKPARFVNLEPDKDEQKLIKDWEVDLSSLDDMLVDLTEASYSVSISYDFRNKCHVAYCNPRGDDHVHYGLMLSGRGSSPYKALKQLCWKHFFILKSDWSSHVAPAEGFSYDD